MNHSRITVTGSRAVMLDHAVTCDGFHADVPSRVQTHIHDDHMDDFDTSKGNQDVLMSVATRDLLVAERNSDLPYRSNVMGLPFGEPRDVDGGQLRLLSSGHMLGAAQVEFQCDDGYRVGYSGDFAWPLDKVIQVEELVVDCTYGSPRSVRAFTQAEAEARLLELVTERLRYGPVNIKAHRGTIQRGIQVLAGSVAVPLLASRRICLTTGVYANHGYVMAELLPVETAEAAAYLEAKTYVRVFGPGDHLPIDPIGCTSINLTAYMSRFDDPVMQYSETSYSVAISNHADFHGTLEYVAATGAKFVLTDNSRGGHAYELADELRNRLGVVARASDGAASYSWGA